MLNNSRDGDRERHGEGINKSYLLYCVPIEYDIGQNNANLQPPLVPDDHQTSKQPWLDFVYWQPEYTADRLMGNAIPLVIFNRKT